MTTPAPLSAHFPVDPLTPAQNLAGWLWELAQPSTPEAPRARPATLHDKLLAYYLSQAIRYRHAALELLAAPPVSSARPSTESAG